MKAVILTAGIHGDEPEGLVLAQQIAKICRVEAAPFTVVLHGMLNPSGFARGTREDNQGRDLNRLWNTVLDARSGGAWKMREAADGLSAGCGAAWSSILEGVALGNTIVVDCHAMWGTPGVFYAGPIGEALAKGCFHNVARLGAWETEGTLTRACEVMGIPAVAVETSSGEGPGALPMAVYRALCVWASYGPKGKTRAA